MAVQVVQVVKGVRVAVQGVQGAEATNNGKSNSEVFYKGLIMKYGVLGQSLINIKKVEA